MSTPDMLPDEQTETRLPPQDVLAEQSVLGGMLLSKDAIAEAVDELSTLDDQPATVFYRPQHGAIFTSIVHLDGRGEPTDPVAVSAELDRRGDLDRVGGAPYLHTLIATVPTAANAGYYAQIVVEQARLRRLIEAGTRIVQYGYGYGNTDDIVNGAQAELHAATTTASLSTGYDHASTGVASVIDDMINGAHPEVIPTGFADLDHVLGGYVRGEVTVVCGRPGHGKTMVGTRAAEACAIRHGLATFMVSLEMSTLLMSQRLITTTASSGRLSLRQVTGRSPRDADAIEAAREAQSRIQNAPLWIDDRPGHTTASLRAMLRRHVQQHGDLDVVIVDYLGLLHSVSKHENRNLEVQAISRALKELAGELNVAVVLLHQLNRSAAESGEPRLHHLRDSGAVEQDAYAVVAVHNPTADGDDTRYGEVDLRVLKNRMGTTATVTVAFQSPQARLADIATPGRTG